MNIDIPRGEGLLPARVLERNKALDESFKFDGYPEFLVLSPSGTNLYHRFNMTPNMNTFAFSREVTSSLRSDPGEISQFLKGMPENKAALYRSRLAELEATRRELDAWLRGNPPISDSNTTIMTAFRTRVETGQRNLEAIELDKYLRDMAGEAAEARAAQLQRAEALVRLAGALEMARADVSNWLLARPEKTENDLKTFNLLTLRVEGLESDIRKLLSSEGSPPLNGTPPEATP